MAGVDPPHERCLDARHPPPPTRTCARPTGIHTGGASACGRSCSFAAFPGLLPCPRRGCFDGLTVGVGSVGGVGSAAPQPLRLQPSGVPSPRPRGCAAAMLRLHGALRSLHWVRTNRIGIQPTPGPYVRAGLRGLQPVCARSPWLHPGPHDRRAATSPCGARTGLGRPSCCGRSQPHRARCACPRGPLLGDPPRWRDWRVLYRVRWLGRSCVLVGTVLA